MEITIGKKTYKDIPESYDSLNLRKFIEVSKFMENNVGLSKEKQTEYGVKLINILTEIPIKDIYKLPATDFVMLMKEFEWLGKKPSTKAKKIVKIDNKEYKFLNMNEITAGEQISIETLHQQSKSKWDITHLVYAILCRPVKGRKKEIIDLDSMEDIKKRADLLMEKMYIGDVYGHLINFTNGGAKRSKSSQGSSVLKIKRNQSS